MSASALAATLFTAPLPGGGAGVFCQVLNVSASPPKRDDHDLRLARNSGEQPDLHWPGFAE